MTSAAYFRSLMILHLALIAGLGLFCIIAFFLISTGNFSSLDADTGKLFVRIAGVIAIIMIVVSRTIFKNRLADANAENTLSGKMMKYRAALIIQFALLEFPALFSVIIALLSGNKLMLVLTLALMLVLFSRKPSLDKALQDLDLSDQESMQLQDPDAIIMPQ